VTASALIADFALSTRFVDLPDSVVAATKLHLIDTLGCGIAAHRLGVADAALAATLEEIGQGSASVIGHAPGLPPTAAAFVNGVLCHALDFDDTHPDAICHVSAVTVPAALAVAQANGVDGRSLVAAIAVANEIVIRIGTVAAPAYMRTGFHPTSVCGVFGAVAAAARLGKCSRTQLVNGFGIAGSAAGGLFEFLSDGSTTKSLHPGFAAQAGLRAMRLAANGSTGPASVLDGRFGVLRTHFRLEPDALGQQVATLGDQWETPRLGIKPFPACHFTHSCLDAAAAAASDLPLHEIESIVVTVPQAAVPLVLEPRSAKIAPRTDYDAKFSLPYSVAAMLVHGRVGLDTFTADARADERVLGLARRVSHEVTAFETFPGAFPGGVRIVTRSGEVRAAEVMNERGSVENPMSENDVIEKFQGNVASALESGDAEALLTRLLRLEEFADVTEGFTALGAARRTSKTTSGRR
jgi:2-methylcitrate dehydratase PrpD